MHARGLARPKPPRIGSSTRARTRPRSRPPARCRRGCASPRARRCGRQPRRRASTSPGHRRSCRG
jgi:hypothetical protein